MQVFLGLVLRSATQVRMRVSPDRALAGQQVRDPQAAWLEVA